MFFWLVVIGGVMLVGVVGCCGALFLMVRGAGKWTVDSLRRPAGAASEMAEAQPGEAI